jgi:hypothetical protein
MNISDFINFEKYSNVVYRIILSIPKGIPPAISPLFGLSSARLEIKI